MADNKIIDRVEILRQVSIFSETSEDILKLLARLLTNSNISASETIFHKGDLGNAMYIIVDGEVNVHDGDHIFTKLSNGQFFGEYSLLDSQVRSASVTAIKDTELLRLDQEIFYDLMTSKQAFSKGVLKSIVRRLYDKDTLEEELATKNAQILLQKEEIEAQRDEIEAQRDEIEAQRDEVISQRDQIVYQKKSITDSIKYARRIQNAVITPENVLNKYSKEHFVFYQPRDIVSGDFYWFKEVTLNNEPVIIVAAADCTGHGVPGAFMSLLGISFLNEIFSQEIITRQNSIDAADVLNRLRNKVIGALNQPGKEDETHDGMDMALAIIYLNKKKIQFSGANNSIYLIRNEESGKTLNELKGEKMPIGIHFRQDVPFTSKEYELVDGDSIYMFSDGFIDQFGGEDGRKYLSKNFKNLLLNMNHLNMDEQYNSLQKEFNKWIGKFDEKSEPHFEQIDDVLVLGIRI